MEEREQAKQLRMLAHNIKAQEHKQTQKSQEAIVKAEAVTALAKIHGERYVAQICCVRRLRSSSAVMITAWPALL
jgi:hypothetical protein